MIFQDNVIKEYLKNVYFITGTPCGGKTTVSRALAEKYGFEMLLIRRLRYICMADHAKKARF